MRHFPRVNSPLTKRVPAFFFHVTTTTRAGAGHRACHDPECDVLECKQPRERVTAEPPRREASHPGPSHRGRRHAHPEKGSFSRSRRPRTAASGESRNARRGRCDRTHDGGVERPRIRPTPVREGAAAQASGGSSVGLSLGEEVGRTNLSSGCDSRKPRRVANVTRGRVPVGRAHVFRGGGGWTPGGAEVGARKRLPLGRSHGRSGGVSGAARNAEVVPQERRAWLGMVHIGEGSRGGAHRSYEVRARERL